MDRGSYKLEFIKCGVVNCVPQSAIIEWSY